MKHITTEEQCILIENQLVKINQHLERPDSSDCIETLLRDRQVWESVLGIVRKNEVCGHDQ